MRLKWVDALRGFAIILMVIGHYNIPLLASKYIYSFHIPLFFFISGYVFRPEKYTGKYNYFIKQKLVQLIVPYICFILLSGICFMVLDAIYQPEITNVLFMKKSLYWNLLSILYAVGPNLLIANQLWFLPCLFITELIFLVLISRYSPKSIQMVVILVSLAIISLLYSNIIGYRLPWSIEISLIASGFFYIGFAHKLKKDIQINDNIIVLLFLIHIITFSIQKIDMNTLRYGNILIFYVASISGILTYFYMFKKLEKSTILQYYGVNTIIVLGTHILIKHTLEKPIYFIFSLEEYPSLIFFEIFLNLLITIPCIYVIKKYFGFAIGNSNKLKKWSN